MSVDRSEEEPFDHSAYRHLLKPPPEPEATPLTVAMRRFFERNGMGKQYRKTAIISAYHSLMGPAVSNVTRKIFLKDDTLFLQLESAVLKQELFANRSRLQQAINQEAGHEMVKHIRFI